MADETRSPSETHSSSPAETYQSASQTATPARPALQHRTHLRSVSTSPEDITPAQRIQQALQLQEPDGLAIFRDLSHDYFDPFALAPGEMSAILPAILPHPRRRFTPNISTMIAAARHATERVDRWVSVVKQRWPTSKLPEHHADYILKYWSLLGWGPGAEEFLQRHNISVQALSPLALLSLIIALTRWVSIHKRDARVQWYGDGVGTFSARAERWRERRTPKALLKRRRERNADEAVKQALPRTAALFDELQTRGEQAITAKAVGYVLRLLAYRGDLEGIKDALRSLYGFDLDYPDSPPEKVLADKYGNDGVERTPMYLSAQARFAALMAMRDRHMALKAVEMYQALLFPLDAETREEQAGPKMPGQLDLSPASTLAVITTALRADQVPLALSTAQLACARHRQRVAAIPARLAGTFQPHEDYMWIAENLGSHRRASRRLVIYSLLHKIKVVPEGFRLVRRRAPQSRRILLSAFSMMRRHLKALNAEAEMLAQFGVDGEHDPTSAWPHRWKQPPINAEPSQIDRARREVWSRHRSIVVNDIARLERDIVELEEKAKKLAIKEVVRRSIYDQQKLQAQATAVQQSRVRSRREPSDWATSSALEADVEAVVWNKASSRARRRIRNYYNVIRGQVETSQSPTTVNDEP